MLVDQRARWRQRWPRVVSSVSSLRCAGQPALERPRVQLALGLRLSREEPVMVGVPQCRYLNALDPWQCLLPRVELSHGARPQPRRRGGASRHDGQRGRRRVGADRAQGALYGGDLRGCHRQRTNETDGHRHSSQHSASSWNLLALSPLKRTNEASRDAAEHESLKSREGTAPDRLRFVHVGQPGRTGTPGQRLGKQGIRDRPPAFV